MTEPSRYQEALDYIYSFVDYSLTKNLRYSPEKFNLSRMNRFLELLGNPHQDYEIIHVAGTKGKGSICAMISSILSQSGHKTGFYSSPHMVDFTERIRIGDNLIPQETMAEYVDELKPTIHQVDQITTFEITTALAFKYFSDQKVDFAVIEVGLGGRFDATNVVTPKVSVISTISFDHTKILGNTLSKIAFEKSGIIKESVLVVISRQKSSALKMIQNIAQQRNSPLIDAKEWYSVVSGQKTLEYQEFDIRNGSSSTGWIRLPLIGDHQLDNARATYAVINELRKQGVNISPSALKQGFEQVKWPGRLEILQRDPLVIIDGAHNPDSFRNLAKTIKEYLPGKKVIFVLGVSEDKNIRTMLQIIKPLVDMLIITKSEHPRAMELEKIRELAQSAGIKGDCIETVEEARIKAESFFDENSVIIAAGSIFIAGAFREIYSKNV
ncbi:MAG: bifunctional folylpolyglutamate synthase/dihydrofolate synthase [Chloroflexi bacterium]|nr:bifunctional folylpolyglutamate synthase/dihydrofolate synthase [Chloroflexota bacterium]